MHFVKPRFYLAIMPDYLPAHEELVYVSGVAEIAGGVGTLIPATRRAGSWWSIATLLAVFPATCTWRSTRTATSASRADPRRCTRGCPSRPCSSFGPGPRDATEDSRRAADDQGVSQGGTPDVRDHRYRAARAGRGARQPRRHR